jgi:hypothetical protein
MGLVAIAESLPYILLGTFGRRLVDRFASLRHLGHLDLARAVLVAALPWTWTTFGTPGLLVSAALLGCLGALFDPNLGALVPELVEPDQVRAVNGLMNLSGRIARVAGPGSAGILLAVLPMGGLFWLDGATFAFSALALGHPRAPGRTRPEGRGHRGGGPGRHAISGPSGRRRRSGPARLAITAHPSGHGDAPGGAQLGDFRRRGVDGDACPVDHPPARRGRHLRHGARRDRNRVPGGQRRGRQRAFAAAAARLVLRDLPAPTRSTSCQSRPT